MLKIILYQRSSDYGKKDILYYLSYLGKQKKLLYL